MTDQEKITALRDALESCRNLADYSNDGVAYDIADKALAMTAEASEPSGEPVAWAVFAPDGNCRIWFGDIEAAQRWKAGYEPTLSSELTPLYTHPATKQASHAADSAPTRRAFDQSALDIFAESAK